MTSYLKSMIFNQNNTTNNTDFYDSIQNDTNHNDTDFYDSIQNDTTHNDNNQNDTTTHNDTTHNDNNQNDTTTHNDNNQNNNNDNNQNNTNQNIFGVKLLSTDKYDMYSLNNYRGFISKVKSWKGNRITSDSRINEIVKSLESENILPLTTLYVSEIVKNNSSKYYLWDGQHRFEAIKKCCMKNNDLKFLDGLFTCIVYKRDTKDNMRKKFININKAIPVPNFYLDELFKSERKLKLKELQQTIVSRIKSEFPYNNTTSNRPLKPNFNPDRLSEEMYIFFDERKWENRDVDVLWASILELNSYYKDNLKFKSDQTKGRAHRTNCFLFCPNHLFLNDLLDEN